METLIQLILVVALAKYAMKAALTGSFWVLVGYATLAAGVALAIYPWVVQQPLTIITDLLSNPLAVGNIALLTTAEAVVGIFISIYLLDNYFRPKSGRTKVAFMLKIVPGVLVFLAIGYFELMFFKLRVGGDFLQTALLFATLLFAVILFVSLGAKTIIRAESLKLEVKVILNLTILVVGLLVSSSVADYNTSHAQSTIEWGALATLVAISLLLVALGACCCNLNFKKILKKQN